MLRTQTIVVTMVEAYKNAVKGVEDWEKSLARSESFERTEEVKRWVARYSLIRDATETGFKKLDKEYRKTILKKRSEEGCKRS